MRTLYKDLEDNTELQEPGQFEVLSSVIMTKAGGVDVMPMIESFNIYESIFKTFVTGNITLLDRVNFINTVNITGTEPITIEFRTKGSNHSVNVNLIVSKVKNKEKVNENITRYTLSLVSPEFIKDSRTKISRSFDGKYSEIVNTIYSTYLSSGVPLWLESTNNNNRVIIPNKSPIDAINMLAQFSLAETADNANFLFFQTTKSFHFRSISEMIYLDQVQSEGITFRAEKEQVSQEIPVVQKATRAIEFEVKSDVDVLRHTALGTYGASLIKHDIRSKSWRRSEFSYHDTFSFDSDKNFIKINEFPISPDGPVTEDNDNLSDFPESYVNMISGAEEYQYQTQQNIPEFEKLDYENTILQRKSEMNSMNIQRAKLSIYGMSGIQAGDVVSMFVPLPDATSGLSGGHKAPDKKLSGKWLVESVAHQVTEKYYCELSLIRDSIPIEQTPYTKLNYPDSTPKIIQASPMGSSNK